MTRREPPDRPQSKAVETAPASDTRAGAAGQAAAGATRRAIPSEQILQGQDAIEIEHNGRIYQLRRTRQGKLILTK